MQWQHRPHGGDWQQPGNGSSGDIVWPQSKSSRSPAVLQALNCPLASAMDEGWQVATGGRKQRKAGRGGAPAQSKGHEDGCTEPHCTPAANPCRSALAARPLLAADANHAAHEAAKPASSSSQPPTERQVQQRCAAVAAAAGEVAAALLWPHLAAQLEQLPPHCSLAALQQMVVYGLGSLEQPGAVHIGYQLALCTLLAAALPALAGSPEAFDPVFTPLDHAVLAHYSIQVRGGVGG